ncbi:MAG: hypothetical protein K6T51_06635 [Rubrobacteraceae bacterium]|uniref:hypothetical protein n=1 Tax=Rubrobacter naiadicus TaxID=1392641 RepID=UPI00235DD4BB|nr:hypothetical protein [Rubrobacter naiadicus]MBX6762922.1 hypothetical protein [Rubrobacteraceae bacterium]MCL6438267.1 hypothetical protein [Rubrobacteraceae bacterium]
MSQERAHRDRPRADAATSGVEADAARLLEAIYDIAGGRPNVPVPLGGEGVPREEGAATRAGFDPTSPACAVAVRYLLNKGYIGRPEGVPRGSYVLGAPGAEEVSRRRGENVPREEGHAMSEKMQRRLVTILAMGLAMGLSRPVNRYIERRIPERRGIKDDLTEAVLQGAVRMTALFGASVIVRRIARRRRGF